jgi:hypothetical protein
MDRNKNISLVIRRLLAEHPDAGNYTIPASLDDRQYMLRALLNVRPPEPVDEGLLAEQDFELQTQLADKGIVKVEDIAPSQLDKRLHLWQGDITRLQVDAIVNAANNALLGCFVPNHRCIDNAIHSAAGIQLRLACQEIMDKQGHPEPTGQAKITPGFNLPSRYVLHTVGPIVRASPWPTGTGCRVWPSAASIRVCSVSRRDLPQALPCAPSGSILMPAPVSRP